MAGIGRDVSSRGELVILLYNTAWGQWSDARPLACATGCEFTIDRRQFFRADAEVFHVASLEGTA